jgi:general secretion pathway protein G
VQRKQVRRSRRSGFTLVELMLVMVILAILAAVVVPKIAGRGEDARKAAAKTDIATIEGALDAFEVDNGRYPTSEEGLNALLQNPGNNVQNWKPYLKLPPKDPWKQDYVYVVPGQHNPNGVDLYTTQGGKDSSGNEINNWGGAQK